jgi:hypothetical protein
MHNRKPLKLIWEQLFHPPFEIPPNFIRHTGSLSLSVAFFYSPAATLSAYSYFNAT